MAQVQARLQADVVGSLQQTADGAGGEGDGGGGCTHESEPTRGPPGSSVYPYTCNICGDMPIQQKRWRCDQCYDFGARANPKARRACRAGRAMVGNSHRVNPGWGHTVQGW